MSLEHALLDRLEKRNAQIAQLQGTIQALERAADAEREHERQQLAPLLEENKKLAAQIEIDEKVSRSNREHAEYQIASLTAEVAKLRAEVPLESTREALKNATAKVAELKKDVRRCYEMADEIGRGEGESIAELIARQAERITGLTAKLQEETKRADKNHVKASALDSIREFAESCGMMSDETVKGFIERTRVELEEVRTDFREEEANAETARADAKRLGDECARLAGKVAELEAQKSAPDFKVMANNLVSEVARLKVKLVTFEKMYEAIKALRNEQKIMAKYKQVYAAVDEVTEALSKLTA